MASAIWISRFPGCSKVFRWALRPIITISSPVYEKAKPWDWGM